MSVNILNRDARVNLMRQDFTSEEGFYSEKTCLEELEQHTSYDELQSIVNSITLANPVSSSLFKEKYQVFIIENLLPWQKPIGDHFSLSFVICGVKSKKILEHESPRDEVFSVDYGNPLSVQYESLRQISEENQSLISFLSEKYDLYPVSECVGRKLLSLCSSLKNVLKIPFTVICHAKNSKSLVIFGVMSADKSLRLRVSTLGTVSKLESLPLISGLKEIHLQGFETTMLSGPSIETSVYATYCFLSNSSKEDSGLIPIKSSKITMECKWFDVHSVLEPLTSNATCIAKLRAVSGDDRTGAYQKYKEIKHIKNLRDCLKYGYVSWSDSKNATFGFEKLEELLNTERNSIYKKESSPPPIIDMNNFDNIVLNERSNLDFPDKLWLVLRDCSSSEELKNAFEIVYNAMKTSFVIPPFVSVENKSSISADIRSMLEKPINCPNLDPVGVLKFLIETGIEKLRKDYTEVFLGLELVSRDLFSYYLQPDLLSREAVIRLEKLHCVLELIIICKKQLTLPKNILCEFARNALKQYTLFPEVDLKHVFNFQIPAVYARPLLNQMRPTIWELSLWSSNKDFRKQSVHRFITTPTIEHIYAPKNYHPKLMLKKASYVYQTATLIEEIKAS